MSVDVERLQKKLDENEKDWAWLAEQIGIDQSTIYRKKKNGFRTLTVEQIHGIVDALSIAKSEAPAIFLW